MHGRVTGSNIGIQTYTSMQVVQVGYYVFSIIIVIMIKNRVHPQWRDCEVVFKPALAAKCGNVCGTIVRL